MITYKEKDMLEMGQNSFDNGYIECLKDISGIIILVGVIIIISIIIW